VKGLVLLCAPTTIGLVITCAPRSVCRTKRLGWAPIRRHFRHHVYRTPTLRAITHRFTYDSLSRCDSHVTDTVPDTIGVQFGCG